MRNKVFQEDRAKDCQTVAECRRLYCVEADRVRQLKLGELSMQQTENPSTLNQLLAQIQELQDKVNSLNDARERFFFFFFDPETVLDSVTYDRLCLHFCCLCQSLWLVGLPCV